MTDRQALTVLRQEVKRLERRIAQLEAGRQAASWWAGRRRPRPDLEPFQPVRGGKVRKA